MLQRNFSVNERITVSANTISDEIFIQLINKLSQFELGCNDVIENSDIVLNQIDDLWPAIPGQAMQMDALYGFWVTIKDGIATLILLHKNEAIISVAFGEKIKIDVKLSEKLKLSKLVNKLYILLLYCFRVCLQTKGCLLIHGGAFAHFKHGLEQNSFLLLGQRGIRKTMISLTLMRKGWHYLSDDKFLLNQHTVYQYQKNILIRDHHFEQLPWLTQVIANSEKYLKHKFWRKFFRELASRLLNKKLLPNEDRLFNKGINCNVSDIFSGQITQQISEPQKVFILKNGEAFHLQKVDKNSAISDIQLLQRMANAEFNDMDDQLSLACSQHVFTPSLDVLLKHFPNTQYFLVSIPWTMSVETICEEIIQCTDCQ